MSGPKRANVLICGWYGTETLGDKAILGGVVESIREVAPQANIDVASIEPYVTRQTARQMPDLGIRSVVGLDDAKSATSQGQYDCVAIGGGPLMSPVRECIDLLELFSRAKRSETRTVVAGCGVGPLTVSHINKAIAGILSLADQVVLRDSQSASRSREVLGYKGPLSVGIDPAFFWLQTHSESHPRANQVLLALREWNLREYAGGMNRSTALDVKRHFESEIRVFVEILSEISPETVIQPFAMHKLAAGGDDRAFYRRIFSKVPKLLDRLDNQHRAPESDLRQFATSRAVLAMRFHSVVFALATRTPVVAVDYTRGGKTVGLLQDVFGTKGAHEPLQLSEFDGTEAAHRILAAQPPTFDTAEFTCEGRKQLVQAFRQVL